MGIFSETQRLEYKTKIARLMACHPKANCNKMMEHLDRVYNLKFSYQFIQKVMSEIRKETIETMQNETLEEEIAQHERMTELLIEELWGIYNQSKTGNRSKIQITKTIHEFMEKLLENKFSAGVFKKQLGNLDINDEQLTTEELKGRIKEILGGLQEAGVNTGLPDLQSLDKGLLDEQGE